jgi:hypothetical protein
MLQARRSPVRVPDEIEFLVDLIDSVSNRNEYQECSLWVMSDRRGRLTASPPSVSRMSENVGASTSCNPKGLHGLYRDNLTYLYLQDFYAEAVFDISVRTSKLYMHCTCVPLQRVMK